MRMLYDISFQLHIWIGVIALFIGPVQFVSLVRKRWADFHRLCGKIYVLSVWVSSVFALLVSFHSTIGFAVVGTSLQSILWFVTTYQAYWYIKKGDVIKHRAFMLMSYSLTLTAPVLRLGIIILEQIFDVNYQYNYEFWYPLLVWVSFLPFAVVWYQTRSFAKP